MRKRFTGFLGGQFDAHDAPTSASRPTGASRPTASPTGQTAPLDASDDYGEGQMRLHRPYYPPPDIDQTDSEEPTRPHRVWRDVAALTTADEDTTQSRDPQTGARVRLGRQQILVAAHDGLVALDLSQTLQRAGYRVVGAVASLGEAVELAYEARPDMAVIDMPLRGAADGREAVYEIQRHLNVPVIVLVFALDRAPQAPAPGLPPVVLMRKPYHAADLLAAVEAAILPPVYDDDLPD